MSHAIEIENLSRSFTVRDRQPGFGGAVRGLFHAPRREVMAVDAVSFRIERGERVAFVGPNGAGKSTTIKMLSGILHPSSGRATVAGYVPWTERRRLAYRIGTVFGQRSQLWYHLPAADTFELLARVYDQEPTAFARRRDALVDAFGIGAHLHKPVRELSLGQRMRCEIVASLLHAPEIVFLDEPTIGLDVSAKATIRDVVRDLSERDGCTVLLTSHDTGDMERVCDRVIVIHRGRVLIDQGIDTLRQRFIRRKLVTLLTAEASIAIDLPGVTVIVARPHRTELEVDLDLTPVEAVVSAAIRTATVRDLTVADPPMDEVVQAIYREAETS
jgi:ABC-2 type transport system ATP-binding protein